MSGIVEVEFGKNVKIFGGPYEPDFVFNSELTDLYAERIVSLPIHPFLKEEEEVTLIINPINSWQPV